MAKFIVKKYLPTYKGTAQNHFLQALICEGKAN
jgi:hypothetical protein